MKWQLAILTTLDKGCAKVSKSDIGGLPFGCKVARPKKIELKLLPDEMDALYAFALQENIAPSNWLIHRLHDAMAVKDGTSIGREELKLMAAALNQVQLTLAGMATNLNQVARAVNSRVKSEDKLSASRLLVLKDMALHLRSIVQPAQMILGRLDNPRKLLPFGDKKSIKTPKTDRQ